MTLVARRQQLIQFLEHANDNKINALYTLLEDEILDNNFVLTTEHLEILNKREDDYKNGNLQPSPWEEVHQRILTKNK